MSSSMKGGAASITSTMTVPPSIERIRCGRNSTSFGIGQKRPSISWRYGFDKNTAPNWIQTSYELRVTRDGKDRTYVRDSGENVQVEWPSEETDLRSREQVEVGIRAKDQGKSGWTEWSKIKIEAALLESSDWTASVIATDIPPPANAAKRPFFVKHTFDLDAIGGPARIYATALGVYEFTVNGMPVGDHVMAPGWQSYNHRLHYQTYELPSDMLVVGENVIQAVVGEGWYSGWLTWTPACRNIWGSEPGVMIQCEVDGKVVAKTSEAWRWAYGPLLSSELYDGETVDLAISEPKDWRPVRTISIPTSTMLISPEAPPIRRTQTLKAVQLITTPSGKKILDFGQNLVGWVKVANIPARRSRIDILQLRFAEVLEKGELGVRPLRGAKATDRLFLGDHKLNGAAWEPKFTTHGFRYCEVTCPPEMLEDFENNFVAVVVHSDMERLGDFECSHEMVNQLHRNVVWGLRGNFVGLPTDCPQRDERLGWTGDIQAFAPTASYLYDTNGFLSDWLADLSEEQLKDNHGVVPLVVPNTLADLTKEPMAQAVWGDVCVITPRDLYQAYGSPAILEEMWQSITTWLDKGIERGENGLWKNPEDGFQLADWLDPRAPPEDPGAAMTDQFLVADAYLVGVTRIAGELAGILGRREEAGKYNAEHERLRAVFQAEYLAPSGRLSSDTQTAYTLAFQFDLLDKAHLAGAADRLSRLVTKGKFRIATGFAGTPGILHALVGSGHLQLAYRMLQEKGCPSFLYPITMGATTVWERWDSMLPDGSVNPGEMTSFNHYALGAMVSFLHQTVAGLKILDPGYKRFIIQPRPGGTITSASTHTTTPYGRAAVSWVLKDGMLKVHFEVPPNTAAIVRLGGTEETVGSGIHDREVKHEEEGQWPPNPYPTRFTLVVPEDTLAS